MATLFAYDDGGVALADAEDVDRYQPREDWSILPSMVAAEDSDRPAKVILFERRGKVDVILWRLRDRKLAAPIVVRVEAGADGVVISSDALNVWGAGDNRYHAIEDFAQTLIDVFETYIDTPPNQLSGDAARYLETLRQHFGLL